MSDAPERIWATHDLRNGYYFTARGPQLRFEDVEYVRADRIEELEAKLAECEARLGKAVELVEKSIKWLRLYGADLHRDAATLAELTSSEAAYNKVKGGKDE